MTRESIETLLDASRLSGLETTARGRVLATVARPDAKGTSYRRTLVELDGERILPLTRGSASIGSVAAAEDGTTFFTAKRVGEDGEEAEDAQLWALPVRGEARELASRTGGFGSLQVAGNRLIAVLEVHSQAADETEHAELTGERTKAKVSAALHAEFPTRYWDHDLGPTRPVLAVAELPEDLFSAEATLPPGAEEVGAGSEDGAGAASAPDADTPSAAVAEPPSADADPTAEDPASDAPRRQVLHFRHLALPPGRLREVTVDRAGERALVAMSDSRGDLLAASDLYLLDLTGDTPPRLLREATAQGEHSPGAFSPDGTRAVIVREQHWSGEAALDVHAEVLDLATGESTDVWPELDRWVHPEWLDDSTLVATSDDQGRGAVWSGAVDAAAPRLLTGGPGQDLAFSSLSVAGGRLIALASGISVAPHPVRIDPVTGEVTALPNPADEVPQPGTLTEVTATAEDGTALRAWLRLPDGEGPHPLVVFAHGGPWGSWNAWTYRWNPGPFVAAGYAVLLPDPAISTGYGQAMIERGQHELGGAPYTDIMALTDATVARDDIDETATAFAGGSYGGYMANWVAGHTGERFRCIVTHASLWDTESMGHTTDNAGWERSMRAQNQLYNPKASVAEIRVPMLVIHGDKDYRVPIAQGHALWYDLHEFSATPRDEQGRTRHRYLYFPDEGHWILGRGNAQVWYETFLGFLDEHVRGAQWERPATLG
ncbi:S9 family peptidase [Brachybacterium aquaticum]|uniref:Dipeptidyl aminopeptidase/acylaminoacyl peptidase n=1 Tax=Brachybacterium aquaticum TaxID=1432564 RepID=A0A841AIV3_9MICO|nr:alpha/beta fold hydrolase [Brachybacterium aquaticum]MBB5833245.1 dipeptidyl aminopeptidase/acylaminoacyl peptidase [Brachybacterium aquaticum]